jgi:galactitol-specific phosphotransferase system IIC component
MQKNNQKTRNGYLGKWMIIGMAIGVGIGVAMNNTGTGLAVGMGIGLAIGGSKWKRAQDNSDKG